MSYPNEVHRIATIAEIARGAIFLGAIVLPVWLAARGVRVWSNPEHTRSAVWREVILAAFVAYLVALAAATVIPLSTASFSGMGSVSLIPGFSTFRCFTHKGDTPAEEFIFCLQNLFGNVALFFPLGLSLPLVSRRFMSIRSLSIAAIAISCTIEIVQYAERLMGTVRTVDIDDVILNFIGACLGYLLVRLLTAPRPIRARDS